MVKPIIRDMFFLAQKSEPAGREDLQVGLDLLDTLRANRERCVGMAANMIGERKRIIAVSLGLADVVMFNPVIVKREGPYRTEEGCLSLDGVRPAARFRDIEVEYRDASWKKQRGRFTGFPAQIIQHEVDHCNGVLI